MDLWLILFYPKVLWAEMGKGFKIVLLMYLEKTFHLGN